MTFNLKEKRKELFEDSLKQFKEVKEIEKILFVVLNCVKDQDNELKESLKEELRITIASQINEDWKDIINEDIDKLFGGRD